jgi:Asp-tRNA(Asn)/Glu-tRNA(Gln) amidotransferase A subunit family amidase
VTLMLEDIELIKRLKYAYCRCLDTANFAEMRTLFTEDASISYVGGRYKYAFQGRDKIIQALENAFHSQAVACHQVHHPEIDVISPTEATGTWYLRDWFLDLRYKLVTEGSALYRDSYVKREGRWLIQRATYERIFETMTEVKDLPNLTSHYLGQHGKAPPPGGF